MGRNENVEIFEDTENLCRTNDFLKESIAKSLKGQKVILENEVVKSQTGREEKADRRQTQIVVSKKRSMEAAMAYQGKKVCVHNFASSTNPGGGVTRGASAQEECLCRVSTLYFCLDSDEPWEKFYKPHRALHNPVYNGDCIYTPGVTVFKKDDASPKLLPEEQWREFDIITCAAPNLRLQPSNFMNPNAGAQPAKLNQRELLDIHMKRGSRILDIAAEAGNEVVILGAFGCGAFQNPVEIVAEAYRRLLKEYEGVFETIEFAVYCSPRDAANYETFRRKFG